MARWKLRAPHYLSVPGTEWEYKETTREGRVSRIVLPVPLHLDPELPADQNYPGEIIVCHEGKGDRRDIVFLGEPTPDMDPLDAEAEEISKAVSHKWIHPIEAMGDGDYGKSLIRAFEQQMTELTKILAPKNISLDGASSDTLAQLKTQVEALVAKNAELEARLEASEAKPNSRRA